KESPGEDVRARLREESFKIQDEAADFFHATLLDGPAGSKARDYLARRGVSQKMIKEFRLGYAPAGWHHLQTALGKKGRRPEALERAGLMTAKTRDGSGETGSARQFYDRFRDRLMFPIWDLQKRVIGFGGRVLGEGTPKYLNSPETPTFSKGRQLYGLEKAREEAGKRGYLVIVEGYMDAIRLRQAGFQAVAATLGTALTEAHLRLVRRFVPLVKLVFDSDEAGIRAAIRTLEVLAPESVSGEVVLLPPGEDPDSFVKQRGLAAFEEQLSRSEKVLDFAIDQSLKNGDVETIEGKIRVVDRFMPVVRKIIRPIERNYYIKQLSERLGLDEAELHRELGSSRQGLNAQSGSRRETPVSGLPPQEKILIQLLIHYPSEIAEVSDRVIPEDFSNPELREIYSEMIKNPKPSGGAGPSGPKAGSSGFSRNGLVAALSLMEPDYEDSRRTLMDCVRALKLKNIQSAMKNIEVEIRQAERSGDGAKVKSLQTELIGLKRKAMDVNVISS
ncbi:MAG TPA: DNA primase, partial [Nitrospiria bacterium]